MSEATRPLSRRKRLFGKAVASVALLALLTLAYATLFEPRWLSVVRVELPLSRLPEQFHGFTIVQLTDIHETGPMVSEHYIRQVVQRANALQPDLIVLTGDYISRSHDDPEPCARLLGGLRAEHGVYGVLGNHDYWDAPGVADAMTAHGVHMLVNEAVAIQRGDARLWIVGLDDYWEGHADIEKAIEGIPADEPVILLVHEPDYADIAAKYPVDVQLSGHSHGGQVRFPILGAPVVPSYAEHYRMGLYKIQSAHTRRLLLYVSRGIGVTGLPVRFLCRPEITFVTVQSNFDTRLTR